MTVPKMATEIKIFRTISRTFGKHTHGDIFLFIIPLVERERGKYVGKKHFFTLALYLINVSCKWHSQYFTALLGILFVYLAVRR